MVWITTIDFPDAGTAPIMRVSPHVPYDEGGTAMEVNEYVLEMLVREKLDAARAITARRALVMRSRPARAPLRERVGAALIALGERLGGRVASRASGPEALAPPRSCATPSASRG